MRKKRGCAIPSRLLKQASKQLTYRWFVGLRIEEPVWDATTFSKNRERREHHVGFV
jgi:hypothetical protein